MEPPELDLLLCQFFMTIRKEDGSEYEPTSLGGMQASFMRYLKRNGYKHNIRDDPLFSRHRDVLVARRKSLKEMGLGLQPNKSDPFTEEEISILYAKGIFGKGTIAISYLYLVSCLFLLS